MSNFVLNKGVTNNTVVTVGERSQLLNPYYLISFTNKFSTDTTVCSLHASVSNDRYDLFEITETTNPDNTSGEVLLMAGEWSYKIYESTTQTLDPNETTGRVLQRGLIIVK